MQVNRIVSRLHWERVALHRSFVADVHESGVTWSVQDSLSAELRDYCAGLLATVETGAMAFNSSSDVCTLFR
jgi:hypothetical protein